MLAPKHAPLSRWVHRPLVVAFLSLLGLGEARAQQFLTLDRQEAGFVATVQTDLVLYDTFVADDVIFVRNDLYLQGGWAGWGGYVDVPMTFVPKLDISTIGNVEFGAMYDMELPLLSLTIRCGVTIPTASQGADDTLALALGQWARVTDFLSAVPNAIAVRPGVSFRLPAGILFGRGDIGVDVQVPLGDESSAITTFFRANVGLGVRWHWFSSTFDYTTAAPITKGDVDFGQGTFVHSAGLSLRFQLPWIAPFIGVSMPLVSGVAGDIVNVSFGVTSAWLPGEDEPP
jgi:hypothetical protein